jgi:hypothetical protein
MTASYELSAIALTTPKSLLKEDSFLNKFTHHRWSIRVRAIPIEDLKAVRDLLESEGYAKLKEWFVDKNKHSGSIGKHSLLIAFTGKQLAYKYYDSV